MIAMEGALEKVFIDRGKFYKNRDSVLSSTDFQMLQKKIQHYWEVEYQAKKPYLSKIGKGISDIFDFFLGVPVYAQEDEEIEGFKEVQRMYGSNHRVSYDGQKYEERVTAVGESTEVLPLLNTNFHQGQPYNNSMKHLNCPANGGKALAGCVPIAYTQVLLYYNTQATRNKIANLDLLYQHHYGSTNNSTRADGVSYADTRLNDAVSTLVRLVYDWHPWTSEGCDETGIRSYTSLNVFDKYNDQIFIPNLGFSRPEVDGLNHDKITQSIQQRKPVIITGTSTGGKGGHMWVLDGIRARTATYTITTYVYNVFILTPEHNPLLDRGNEPRFKWPVGTPSVRYETRFTMVNDKIHNNWGWDESNGKLPTYKSLSSGEWTDKDVYRRGEYHYAHELRIVPFITPL